MKNKVGSFLLTVSMILSLYGLLTDKTNLILYSLCWVVLGCTTYIVEAIENSKKNP